MDVELIPLRQEEATEKVSISNIYIPYIVRNNNDDTICCMLKLILITFSVPSDRSAGGYREYPLTAL
jgi:hypothetical protein